jgi:hypothetical protein
MHGKNRKEICAYFKRFPQLVIGVAAVSLIVALASDAGIGQLLGVLGLALSGTISFYWFKLQPTDAQMDSWLREDLMNLQPRALTKGGLDISDLVRDAVSVIGPRFRNLCGSDFGFRKGRDGRARFTPVDVTIINFTEHQLVVYQCALDLTTGKPLNECIDEYFYNDIVSVATRSDTFTYMADELDRKLLERIPDAKKSTVEGKIQVNGAETFILSTSGGTSVRVVLNDPVLVQGLGGGELPLEWAEQAVQAVRKMLREKKVGALPLRGAGI